MLKICKKITQEFSNYENLIICLYDNSDEFLSDFDEANISIDKIDQAKYWLAMYTYNPIEGAYFDDNQMGILEPFSYEKIYSKTYNFIFSTLFSAKVVSKLNKLKNLSNPQV